MFNLFYNFTHFFLHMGLARPLLEKLVRHIKTHHQGRIEGGNIMEFIHHFLKLSVHEARNRLDLLRAMIGAETQLLIQQCDGMYLTHKGKF